MPVLDDGVIGLIPTPPPLAVRGMTSAAGIGGIRQHRLGDQNTELDREQVVAAVVDVAIIGLGRMHRRAKNPTVSAQPQAHELLGLRGLPPGLGRPS